MSLWACDDPRTGRCLVAAPYVLDSNGAPLRIGWDWAASSVEFNAPDPLICPLPHGLSAPSPTIAEAEQDDKRAKVDLGTRAIPEDAPLNLDALPPDRARLGKNTRLPVASASDGGTGVTQMTPEQYLRAWKAGVPARKSRNPTNFGVDIVFFR